MLMAHTKTLSNAARPCPTWPTRCSRVGSVARPGQMTGGRSYRGRHGAIGASQDLRALSWNRRRPHQKRRSGGACAASRRAWTEAGGEPPPKLAGRSLGLCSSRQGAETGSLSRSCSRLPASRDACRPVGREIVAAVAATCRSCGLRPSRSTARVRMVGSWPMILHCWLSRSPRSFRAGPSGSWFLWAARRSERRAGGGKKVVRGVSQRSREVVGTERWFRRVGQPGTTSRA